MTVLNFDFDSLTVGEIDTLEDELNTRCRDVLGDKVVTFNDIIEQFRPNGTPAMKIPQGKILRVLALLQLRKTDPEATWEQAGELQLKIDVPKAETLTPPSPPTDGND